MCKGARAGECGKCPSEARPLLLGGRCPTCNGDEERRKTCPACKGWGQNRVCECPQNIIEPDAWEAIRAAKMADMGILPVSGGYLEQAEQWRDAVLIVTAERARYES